MRTNEVFLDLDDDHLVHASLTCERHVGLVELAHDSYGESMTSVEELLAALSHRGHVLPAWAARGLRYCAHCTLVAAVDWAVAA